MSDPFVCLIVGLVLGALIGSIAMWLYLMRKFKGRPIQWLAICESVGLAIAIIGLWLLVKAP
jgi:hypothetical protein